MGCLMLLSQILYKQSCGGVVLLTKRVCFVHVSLDTVTAPYPSTLLPQPAPAVIAEQNESSSWRR